MTDQKILTIADVLHTQKELNNAMGEPMGEGFSAVKENVLSAIVELVEVLNETPWKPWKKYDGHQTDREALLTEMTDVLQFWANMVNSMGYTADDVAISLASKWSENYRRLSQ